MLKINSFRNDLQELRGLAVLLIFFFHLDQILFKYFYIGVDIFFIISGYVITSSIYISNKKKKFKLINFFLKRIKRIYPALIVFLLIFNLSFFILVNYSDSEFLEIIFSSLFTILGISNFFYALSPNLDYFTNDLKWLQHTWSLSNEIQFYFLYGIFFAIIIKFINSVNKNEKFFIILLGILSLISLYFFIFSKDQLTSSYYFSFSRFWEFFIGSICFFLANLKVIKIKNCYFALSLFFFLFFLFIVNFTNTNISYQKIILPSLLIISLGIIFSKNNKVIFFHNFLDFYGKISYSFFLWHLPIISYLKIYNTNILEIFFISFILTSIISYLSYYFIEVRYIKKINLDKKILIFLKAFFTIFFVICFIFFLNKNFIFKARDFFYQKAINFYKFTQIINLAKNVNKVNDNWIFKYDYCENEFENFSWSERVNCIFENGNDSLVFLTGNSYADHIVPALSFIDVRFTFFKSRFENCYISNNSKCNDKSHKIILSYNEISKNFIKKKFVISLNGRDYSISKIKKIFSMLDSDTEIYIFYPHPTVKIFNNIDLFNLYKSKKELDIKKLKLISDKTKITVIDTFAMICDLENCLNDNYENNFTDGSHFTIETNKLVSKKIKEILF